MVVMKFRQFIEAANKHNSLAIEAWGIRVDARGLLGCALAAAVVVTLLW